MTQVTVIQICLTIIKVLKSQRQINRAVPTTKVLILSSYSDDEYISQATEAGAVGYLVKQTAGNELLKAIREAHCGNAYFSPSIAKRLRDQCREAFAGGQPTRKR